MGALARHGVPALAAGADQSLNERRENAYFNSAIKARAIQDQFPGFVARRGASPGRRSRSGSGRLRAGSQRDRAAEFAGLAGLVHEVISDIECRQEHPAIGECVDTDPAVTDPDLARLLRRVSANDPLTRRPRAFALREFVPAEPFVRLIRKASARL